MATCAEADRVHDVGVAYLLAMQDAAITAWLTPLQAAYQQAYNTYKAVFDNTLKPAENADPLKQSLGLLPGLSAQVVSKIMAILTGQFNDALTPDLIAQPV